MKEEVGRALWKVIHGYAVSYPDTPTDETTETARHFFEVVISETVRENSRRCSCSTEWEQMLYDVPPPYHNREALYWWTVAAHDRVRRKQGKKLHHPEISLQHPLLR